MQPSQEQQIANLTVPEIHRANQIIWFALLAGATMIGFIFYFLEGGREGFFNQERFLNSIFTMNAIAVTLFSALGAHFVLKKRKEDAAQIKGLKPKLADFRDNFILNAALHEGPLLICLVFTFIDRNGYFLLLAAVNWILLYLTRPTLEKFKASYSLTSGEKQELKAAFPNQIV